jgi:hypothetical protein
MRWRLVALAGVFAVSALSCARTQKSSTGFHMPDGDAMRGQQTFVAFKCNACHRVDGVELPAPVADPPVPVMLGGVVHQVRTDGELAAAIIEPSHRITPGYRKAALRSGGMSRMPDFGERMTVSELVDIVAFLQSRYEVRPPPQYK